MTWSIDKIHLKLEAFVKIITLQRQLGEKLPRHLQFAHVKFHVVAWFTHDAYE